MTNKILDAYKKYCTNLDCEMPTQKDYQALKQLSDFINNGVMSFDKVVDAFKKANASDFLCGKKTSFKADIKWLCNPVNIDKVLDGKYTDHKPKKEKIKGHFDNYTKDDWKALEIKLHNDMVERVERLKKDKEFRKWEEEYFYVKYPNMRKGAL